MADNELNFKINIEPQLENLEKIKNQLSSAVKETGDKDLIAQYREIENRLNSINKVMSTFKDRDMPIESFKVINKNIGETLKLMHGLGKGLSSALGDNSLEAVEKLDKEIEKIDKQIEQSTRNLEKYKNVLSKSRATGEIGLKPSYAKSEVIKADIHGFNKGGEMSQNRAATPEQVSKIIASLEGRQNRTPEMTAMLEKAKEVLSKLNETLNTTKSAYLKDTGNIAALEQQRDQLEQTKQEEIQKAEVASTNIDDLDAKQAEVKKLNIDILTAQTQNKITGQEVGGGKKPGGEGGLDTTDTVESMKGLNTQVDKQPSKFGTAIKSMASYTIVLSAMRRAVRSAVKTVKTLDKALTEQAMVSGRTRESTYALLKSYQSIAMQSGATTKEVAQVATQYFRQGKTAKDALTLTEAAVKAAKVASISTADSVDYLTTAINGFKLAAEDAMSVSDKFSALAAKSATSYEELAIALSKVASQANLAGMSMDYTLGLLAKGIETTREAPETIGTALKTVIARMREIKDYGETLEGDSNINNVEQQLQYVGIALRTQNGELRSTEDVLDELGQK